jgi:hypothetical protein
MRRSLTCLGLVAALSLSAPLVAAPPAPDAARMAAAARLLEAIHYDSLVDRTMDALIADQQKTFPQRLEAEIGSPLPDDLKAQIFDVIAQSIRSAMTVNRAEMRRGVALMYASRFTAPEIEHLIQLQTDPVMLKMQAEMPGIMTESAALGQAAIQREMPNMTKKLEALIKNYYGKDGKPAA